MEKELKDKIKRRAKKAFEDPSMHHHRIDEIGKNTLRYRIKSGEYVMVYMDKIGRLTIKL